MIERKHQRLIGDMFGITFASVRQPESTNTSTVLSPRENFGGCYGKRDYFWACLRWFELRACKTGVTLPRQRSYCNWPRFPCGAYFWAGRKHHDCYGEWYTGRQQLTLSATKQIRARVEEVVKTIKSTANLLPRKNCTKNWTMNTLRSLGYR